MASKTLKVPALQGSAALLDGGSIDFVMPQVEAIDPSSSYISIRADAVVTGPGVHAVYFDWLDRAPHRNGVLISDYELRSSTAGVLEACLQSNVPRANLAAFERDIDQLRSDNYRALGTQFADSVAGAYSAGGFYDGAGSGAVGAAWTVASPFMSARGGAQPTDVRIYLDELSPLCRQAPALDLSALGEVRLRTRLDLSRVGKLAEHMPHTSMWGSIPCDNLGAPANIITTAEQALDAGVGSVDFEIRPNDPVLLQYTVTASGAVVVEARTATAVALSGAAPATVAITVDGGPIPISTLVYVQKITGLLAGVPILMPVQTDHYVTLNPAGLSIGPVEIAQARAMYLGRRIAITYPAAGGGTWDGATVAAVTPVVVAGVTAVRLKITANLTQVPTGAGHVYIVSTPPTAPDVVDATRTILTFNAMTVDRLRLWPGAAVRVTCDDGAAPPVAKAAVETTINSVTQVGATVVVTLAAAIPNQPANHRIRMIPATSMSLLLSSPMLVLKVFPANVTVPREILFETWEQEVTSMPVGTRQFQRIFMTPPGCTAVFFLLVNRVGGDVLSFRNTLASYRLRINEVPTSASEIVPFEALHRDAMITAIEASPLAALRNLGDGYAKARNPIAGTLLYDTGDVLVMPAITDPTRANSVGLILNFRAATTGEMTLYAVRSQTHVLATSGGRSTIA